MRYLLIILALCQLASAQEIPIEIELVPPQGVHFIELSIPKAKVEKVLIKPEKRPCRVCAEVVVPGSCPCYELLTQTVADELYDEVVSHLKSVGGEALKLKRPVNVRVVSRKRLAQMGGERLLGLYQDDTIWLSLEMNRRQALGIMAHEYGHAWFFHHRADVTTPNDLLFEGFPEFLSYLVLKEAGDNEGAYRISTVDQSVYGRGARRIISMYNRAGLGPVIQLALTGSSV